VEKKIAQKVPLIMGDVTGRKKALMVQKGPYSKMEGRLSEEDERAGNNEKRKALIFC